MHRQFLRLSFEVPAPEQELLIAVLAEQGFLGVEQEPDRLRAYMEKDFEVDAFNQQCMLFFQRELPFEREEMVEQNWNAVWEENYPSVEVDDFCLIRPSFRASRPEFTYELVIDPKMSFGTGNHETTRMMIKQMREFSFQDKAVLDMGCGTGVLGILASKMGAKSVFGIDIDSWSFENATENVALNQVENMELRLGTVKDLDAKPYEIILANINLGVLASEIHKYSERLLPEGVLVISGFYQRDGETLITKASETGLTLIRQMEENDWLSLCFKKPY